MRWPTQGAAGSGPARTRTGPLHTKDVGQTPGAQYAALTASDGARDAVEAVYPDRGAQIPVEVVALCHVAPVAEATVEVAVDSLAVRGARRQQRECQTPSCTHVGTR